MLDDQTAAQRSLESGGCCLLTLERTHTHTHKEHTLLHASLFDSFPGSDSVPGAALRSHMFPFMNTGKSRRFLLLKRPLTLSRSS